MREQLPQRRYRVATEEDKRDLSMTRSALVGVAKEVLAAGFTELGDVAYDSGARYAGVYMRTFVDAARTTVVLVGVMSQSSAHHSARGADRYVSSRHAGGHLAEPPFLHGQWYPNARKTAELVAWHRELLRVNAADRDLVVIADVDALVTELVRAYGRMMAWRDSQPPEMLLDADVRAMLGDRYERLGARTVRWCRARPPRATARVR